MTSISNATDEINNERQTIASDPKTTKMELELQTLTCFDPLRVEMCASSTQASTTSEEDNEEFDTNKDGQEEDEKVWITIIDKNTDMPEYDGKWLQGDQNAEFVDSDNEEEENFR